MDTKSFIAALATNTGRDTKEVSAMIQSLGNIIADSIAESDNIALPGFGTFESVRNSEYVADNPETGGKTLFPPSIKINYIPGSRIKKAVADL